MVTGLGNGLLSVFCLAITSSLAVCRQCYVNYTLSLVFSLRCRMWTRRFLRMVVVIFCADMDLQWFSNARILSIILTITNNRHRLSNRPRHSCMHDIIKWDGLESTFPKFYWKWEFNRHWCQPNAWRTILFQKEDAACSNRDSALNLTCWTKLISFLMSFTASLLKNLDKRFLTLSGE